jgi:Flp pilus assembly protein TadD
LSARKLLDQIGASVILHDALLASPKRLAGEAVDPPAVRSHNGLRTLREEVSMRSLLVGLLSLVLAACAAAPAVPPATGDPLFADALFSAPSHPVDPLSVFAVSEPMKRYLAEDIGIAATPRGRQRALIDALRRQKSLRLEYDAAYTRNAAEAFEERTGNCLSLVIMTAALAREMGIAVRFQRVHVDDTLSRSGNMQLFAGHVNVTLGRRPPATGSNIDDGEQYTIDFLPPPDIRGLRWREIGENTILAMYLNNRAVEAVAAGRVDDAYWFSRESVRQDPEFAAAYNTLGVIYGRKRRPDEAVLAFNRALARQPNNTRALANLVPVLQSVGRVREAAVLQARLKQLEPEPPFSLFERGLAAMEAGDYARARDLFARELERAPDYHEFHYWLAAALTQLGQDEEARRHLALALNNSVTRQDTANYAGKLARLKQGAR